MVDGAHGDGRREEEEEEQEEQEEQEERTSSQTRHDSCSGSTGAEEGVEHSVEVMKAGERRLDAGG